MYLLLVGGTCAYNPHIARTVPSVAPTVARHLCDAPQYNTSYVLCDLRGFLKERVRPGTTHTILSLLGNPKLVARIVPVTVPPVAAAELFHPRTVQKLHLPTGNLTLIFIISFSTRCAGQKAGTAYCRIIGRILLVILFPRDTAAVTALDSSDFWAFNEGMSEA